MAAAAAAAGAATGALGLLARTVCAAAAPSIAAGATLRRRPSAVMTMVPVRHLSLHEYQSKRLLAQHGVATQNFRMATTPQEAYAAAKYILDELSASWRMCATNARPTRRPCVATQRSVKSWSRRRSSPAAAGRARSRRAACRAACNCRARPRRCANLPARCLATGCARSRHRRRVFWCTN